MESILENLGAWLQTLPEVGRGPGRLRRGRAAHRFAAGKVQPAVPVYPRAQLPLRLRQLRGGKRGRTEAVLHIAAQDGLRRFALEEAQ